MVKNPPAKAGDTGWISDGKDPTCHEKNEVCAPQLMSLCSRAQELQPGSPEATVTEGCVLELVVCNKRSRCAEELMHHNYRVAPATLR